MKKIFFILSIPFILFSCNNAPKQEDASATADSTEVAAPPVDTLNPEYSDYTTY